jgi:peptide/nickel transport system permease protein
MSERLPPEGSVTIDLSRKKKRRQWTAPARVFAPYTSVLYISFQQLKKSRLAKAGALVFALLSMIAIFADLVAGDLPIACRMHGQLYLLPAVTRPATLEGYDNLKIARDLGAGEWAIYPLMKYGPRTEAEKLVPPLTSGHLLGTDARGRDVFARILHGTRTALTVGMMAVLAFVGIGIVLGALAGFYGGLLDATVARIIETLTAFPTIILVLVVQAILPRASMYTLLLAIGLTRWTEVARLVRAEVLHVNAQEYVMAARALGASPGRVLRRHVLPNAVAPALVAATFGVASVVLIEASLDFLRVGVPPESASWGEILSGAREVPGAWWLLVFPGTMIFLTVASLNLVGEALRDALDPRLRDAPHRAALVGTAEAAETAARASQLPPTAATFDEGTHT